MKQLIDTTRARTAAVAAAIALAAAASGVARADEKDDIAAIWKDPRFQKQFVGSYGINADVEPRVTPDEVKILEKIRPLMADKLPQAEAALVKAMKPDCSAILDYTLGSIDFQQEKYEDAAALLDVLIERYPDKTDFWILQAQTYIGMKQPLRATRGRAGSRSRRCRPASATCPRSPCRARRAPRGSPPRATAASCRCTSAPAGARSRSCPGSAR